jgi:hypothetical protein
VELGGIAFLNYRFELTDGQDNFNTFDVTRTYVFASVKPMDHVRFRVTLDAPARETVVKGSGATTEVTQNAGKLDVIVKHAFVELYEVGTPGLSIKFGQQDLPWVPFEEKQWTYRFQGPVLADREGYLSSTDLGIGASYVLPSKQFEGHASLVNGETFGKPEVSKHKDVHARLTVRPIASLSGLGMHVFYSEGRGGVAARQGARQGRGLQAYPPRGGRAAAWLRPHRPGDARQGTRHIGLDAACHRRRSALRHGAAQGGLRAGAQGLTPL